MAERPILFNTDMVKAILEGRKTQTRRVVKEISLDEAHFMVKDGVALACDGSGYWYRAEKFCRVQPGDVLWVRETWQCLSDFGQARYEYRADRGDDDLVDGMYITWRPSIHMPKEAARLFLRVTGVRCERLQCISEADVKAEGTLPYYCATGYLGESPIRDPKKFDFARIWDSTIKAVDRDRCGWYANPWVWVIEFEREDREARA